MNKKKAERGKVAPNNLILSTESIPQVVSNCQANRKQIRDYSPLEYNPTRKILQIIPAGDGWYARYWHNGKIQYSKVACFALIEEIEAGKKYQNVWPMTGFGEKFEPVSLCSEANFDGIEYLPEIDQEQLL